MPGGTGTSFLTCSLPPGRPPRVEQPTGHTGILAPGKAELLQHLRAPARKELTISPFTKCKALQSS